MCSLAFESPIILLEKIIFGPPNGRKTKDADTVDNSSNTVIETVASIGRSTDELIKTEDGTVAAYLGSIPNQMENGNEKLSYRF